MSYINISASRYKQNKYLPQCTEITSPICLNAANNPVLTEKQQTPVSFAKLIQLYKSGGDYTFQSAVSINTIPHVHELRYGNMEESHSGKHTSVSTPSPRKCRGPAKRGYFCLLAVATEMYQAIWSG